MTIVRGLRIISSNV